MKVIRNFPAEALVWFTALILLALFDARSGSHFTICPFYHLGFDFCPGCGLGRSVSYLFHGEIIQSLKVHPLGIFAVAVLSFRIVQLSKNHLKSHGKSY